MRICLWVSIIAHAWVFAWLRACGVRAKGIPGIAPHQRHPPKYSPMLQSAPDTVQRVRPSAYLSPSFALMCLQSPPLCPRPAFIPGRVLIGARQQTDMEDWNCILSFLIEIGPPKKLRLPRETRNQGKLDPDLFSSNAYLFHELSFNQSKPTGGIFFTDQTNHVPP